MNGIMGEIAHVRKWVGLSRPSQVGDDVPHAVVGEEEEFAARLRKVVDPVARVKHLQNHRFNSGWIAFPLQRGALGLTQGFVKSFHVNSSVAIQPSK